MKKVLSNTQSTPNPNPVNMKETIRVVDKSMKTMINKPTETLANRTQTTKEQGMGYDIIEDIKKMKANISLFGLCNLPQQRRKLLEFFDPHTSSILEAIEFDDEVNVASIGGKYNYQNLPFLII